MAALALSLAHPSRSAAQGPAPGQPPPQGGSLTGGPQIARIYDAILDARFEQVPDLLGRSCDNGIPPRGAVDARVPKPVCSLLETVALWWQIQINPSDTALDARFQAESDAAIAGMLAWTEAEPQRAEAWFYLGGAYGARGQWRVLRGQVLSAARDGKRIKASLERALALDPTLLDAYFGIGLYHYYADVAPTAAKIFRFLLLLPGGDRAEGLREMLRSRDGGQLLRSEAEYQLHVIYLWYEKDYPRAISFVAGLRDRYPRNPHFPQVIAEIQDGYQHDTTASLRSWQALLAQATGGRVALAPMAEARARLGIATMLDRLQETDAALAHLREVIADAPAAPFGAVPQARLQLAQGLDRLGYRAAALEEYQRALDGAMAVTGAGDPLKIGQRARAGIRTTPDATSATAYRLSIDGWRAFERGAISDADRTLRESLRLRPDDTVAKYRHARVLVALKNDSAALARLEQVVSARDATPPTVYADACIEAARLHEQAGAPSRALELYTNARGVFGADERTKALAQRAMTRLANAQ